MVQFIAHACNVYAHTHIHTHSPNNGRKYLKLLTAWLFLGDTGNTDLQVIFHLCTIQIFKKINLWII